MPSSDIQEQPSWILHNVLDMLQEGDSLTSVNESVVIRQSYSHDWPRDYLTISDHRTLIDAVHAQNC